MKKNKRNLIILSLILGVIFYGTSAVISFTVVPAHPKKSADTPERYLRSLKMELVKAVSGKRFHEAEVMYRRLAGIEKENRMIGRLGSVIYFRNGKLNEAENLLRNLLLRSPGDFVCRNNYGMVLMVKNNPAAFRELKKAWEDSGRSRFIEENLLRCAALFKVKFTPDEKFENENDEAAFLEAPPLDAITLAEEKI